MANEDRMKVMHYHFGKDGGAERFFVHLVNALARRGVEQTAVIRPNRLWRKDVEPHARLIESNFRNLSPDRILLPLKVKHLARRERPDALFSWATRARATRRTSRWRSPWERSRGWSRWDGRWRSCWSSPTSAYSS